MTHESFMDYVQNRGDEVVKLVQRKNADYAGGNDNPFAAFDEAAAVLGLTREQVWAVFYIKHVQAVMKFIKSGHLEDEDIQSRLMDLTAYPLILSAMLAE